MLIHFRNLSIYYVLMELFSFLNILFICVFTNASKDFYMWYHLSVSNFTIHIDQWLWCCQFSFIYVFFLLLLLNGASSSLLLLTELVWQLKMDHNMLYLVRLFGSQALVCLERGLLITWANLVYLCLCWKSWGLLEMGPTSCVWGRCGASSFKLLVTGWSL